MTRDLICESGVSADTNDQLIEILGPPDRRDDLWLIYRVVREDPLLRKQYWPPAPEGFTNVPNTYDLRVGAEQGLPVVFDPLPTIEPDS